MYHVMQCAGCTLRSLEIFSIEFSNSFTFSSCSRNMAGRFRSLKSKEEETSLVSEATPKTRQYNNKMGKKSLWRMAAATAKYVCKVRSCWSGRDELRRCWRSDRSTRAHVAKCAKLLVEQVRLWSGKTKWRALSSQFAVFIGLCN